MRRLTLGDLKLGLADLFDNRREALNKAVSGRIYAPMLEKKRADIAQRKELPQPITVSQAIIVPNHGSF